jgi:hypothetical protein
MKLIKTCIVLAIVIFFAGSSYSQTGTDTTKLKKKSSTKKVYKSYKGCKQSSGDCTYFILEYQIVKSGKAKKFINNAIQDSILKAVNIWDDKKAADFKDAAANFISEYENSLKENTNGASWYLETNGKVNSNTKNVLSYAIGQSMYTGGAHPNTYLAFYNFNKENGNQVTLADVFGANFDNALNKIIDTEFRKMKGLSATDNLQDKAGLFENKITYTNNFAIEKKGITFYYNAYDIAAYVYGPTDLFIPWENLTGIMSEPGYYTK